MDGKPGWKDGADTVHPFINGVKASSSIMTVGKSETITSDTGFMMVHVIRLDNSAQSALWTRDSYTNNVIELAISDDKKTCLIGRPSSTTAAKLSVCMIEEGYFS